MLGVLAVDALLVVVPALAAAASARTARRVAAERPAWLLLAAGCAAWALGEAVWTALVVTTGDRVPFPSAADAVFLASVPLLGGGLLLLLHSSARPGGRPRVLLDGLLVAVGVAAVAWLLVVEALPSGAPAAERAVALAYPLGDVVLATLALALLHEARAAGRPTRTPRLLCLGLLALVGADMVFAVLTQLDAYSSVGPAALGWAAGFALVALAARQRRVEDAAVAAGPSGSRSEPLLPYAPLAVAGFLAVAVAVRDGRLPLAVPALAGLAVAVLVARQLLISSADDRVAEDLEDAVARSTAEVAASERLFRALVHSSSDATLVLDAEGTVRYASPAVRRVLGRDTADVHGRSFLALVHPGDEDRAAGLLDTLGTESGAMQVTALRLRHADGSVRHVELALTNLLGDPAVGGVVVNAHDTTERQALEAELVRQAFYDALTGLANRSLFAERVEHALLGRLRHPEGFAVLLLDLDGFKQVNDAFGHGAGDELLGVVAGRLQYCVRPDDTVARLGGDEFALFLEHLDPDAAETAALAVAERVLAALAEPVVVAGQPVVVTGSIGVALVEPTTVGVEELVRNADLAMYRAKTLGKNQAVVYAQALHEAASLRLTLAAELRAAVEDCELVLHYQPVVDVSTGQVTGAEALVRWPHAERGLVPPLDFIPVAEENGLIVPLGRWVLEEACRQASTWKALLPPGAPFTMCVNVSGRQFQTAGLVPTVREALALAHLDPQALVLELTESVLMEDDERSLGTLQELRALGLGLAIDDFGTGYSSLRYLKRFPVTALKIDRSFVEGLDGGPDDSAVARAVLRLGQTLRLDVVAEGVERSDQVDVLRSLGCSSAQGYHYGRPVPAEEFTRLVASALPLVPAQRPGPVGGAVGGLTPAAS